MSTNSAADGKDFDIHKLFVKQKGVGMNIDPEKLAEKRKAMMAAKAAEESAAKAGATPAQGASPTKLSVSSQSFNPKTSAFSPKAPATPSSVPVTIASPAPGKAVAPPVAANGAGPKLSQGAPVPTNPKTRPFPPPQPMGAHGVHVNAPPNGRYIPQQYNTGGRYTNGPYPPYMVGPPGPQGYMEMPMMTSPPPPMMPMGGAPFMPNGSPVPGPAVAASQPMPPPFVPKQPSKVVIKRPDGTAVDLASLKKKVASTPKREADSPKPVAETPKPVATPKPATPAPATPAPATPAPATPAPATPAPATPARTTPAPAAADTLAPPATLATPAASKAIQIISPASGRPIALKPSTPALKEADAKVKAAEVTETKTEAAKDVETESEPPKEVKVEVEAPVEPKAAVAEPKAKYEAVKTAPVVAATAAVGVATAAAVAVTAESTPAPPATDKPAKYEPIRTAEVKTEAASPAVPAGETATPAAEAASPAAEGVSTAAEGASPAADAPPAEDVSDAPPQPHINLSGPSFNAALKKAEPIADLTTVTYPATVRPPKPELIANHMYRYDRDFLLQFMHVCREKPELLPDLEKIGMVENRPPMGGRAFPPHMQKGPHHMSGPNARFPSHPGGAPRNGFQQGPMGGHFGANNGPRRQQSFGQMGGRQRSGPGAKREYGMARGGSRGAPAALPAAFYAPLEVTENRWVPKSLSNTKEEVDHIDLVKRKVQALLNKLTLENFPRIVDQILTWADSSAQEEDGRTLRQVIALIFLKATDEPLWSEMYARLCRQLMERLSDDVMDAQMRDKAGEPVRGGALFRKYLLNRCQEDYTNGWKAAADAAADAAAERTATKKAERAARGEAPEGEAEELAAAASATESSEKPVEFLSEAYFAAQKLKRRGLGLVRFIGELYGLQMVTDRIIVTCLMKLVDNVNDPDEEDIESLCRLITTVGRMLNTDKNRANLQVVMLRMRTMVDSENLSSRARFMIQDVLELADNKWLPRHNAQGPKTISQIHSDARREKEAPPRRSTAGGSRAPQRNVSRRGAPAQQTSDGWSVPANNTTRAGDLTSFGKVRSSSGVTLGPQGAFANKNSKLRRGGSGASTQTTASAASVKESSGNLFALLSEGGDPAAAEAAPEEAAPEDAEPAADPAADARRIAASIDELFNVRSVTDAVDAAVALSPPARETLVDKLSTDVSWKKPADVDLTADVFRGIVAAGALTHERAVAAVAAYVTSLPDLAIDIPKLYTYAAQLLHALGLTAPEVSELATKMVSSDEDDFAVEEGQTKLVAEFEKL